MLPGCPLPPRPPAPRLTSSATTALIHHSGHPPTRSTPVSMAWPAWPFLPPVSKSSHAERQESTGCISSFRPARLEGGQASRAARRASRPPHPLPSAPNPLASAAQALHAHGSVRSPQFVATNLGRSAEWSERRSQPSALTHRLVFSIFHFPLVPGTRASRLETVMRCERRQDNSSARFNAPPRLGSALPAVPGQGSAGSAPRSSALCASIQHHGGDGTGVARRGTARGTGTP